MDVFRVPPRRGPATLLQLDILSVLDSPTRRVYGTACALSSNTDNLGNYRFNHYRRFPHREGDVDNQQSLETEKMTEVRNG